MIRGELIKWGARKKKDREKEITQLSNTIAKLELQHKQSLSSGVADELIHARNSLKQLLNLQTQKSLFFKKSIFYEHGDKSGKQLARALKDATIANHVHSIRDTQGILEHKPDLIAKIFHKFYSKLYDLPPQHKPPTYWHVKKIQSKHS